MSEKRGLRRRRPIILVTNINIEAAGIPIVLSRIFISPQHLELVVKFD